jgi:hypothetical protein
MPVADNRYNWHFLDAHSKANGALGGAQRFRKSQRGVK